MGGLLIILSIILIFVVLVQIGRINEIAVGLRGKEQAQRQANNRNAVMGLVFMVAFLIFVIVSFFAFKDRMLGFGPHESASHHGGLIDGIFLTTLIITGIVFFITHILLFWYSYKYRGQKGRVAKYIPHDNRLELIWMVVPAIVMTFLVIGGLSVWNESMADVPDDMKHGLNEGEFLEIEATGFQFGWLLRYPGATDFKLGTRDFRNIKAGYNETGQVWTDEKNHDDFLADTLYLPKDHKIRIRIIGRDVLHNFYLPHFRVKMDAVPGMPTYFVFTPTKTTEEYRESLSGYPEWQAMADPSDPENKFKKWETFEYELACAELCGDGHFSMQKIVRVVEMDEFKKWYNSKKSFYSTEVNPPKETEVLSRETSLEEGHGGEEGTHTGEGHGEGSHNVEGHSTEESHSGDHTNGTHTSGGTTTHTEGTHTEETHSGGTHNAGKADGKEGTNAGKATTTEEGENKGKKGKIIKKIFNKGKKEKTGDH